MSGEAAAPWGPSAQALLRQPRGQGRHSPLTDEATEAQTEVAEPAPGPPAGGGAGCKPGRLSGAQVSVPLPTVPTLATSVLGSPTPLWLARSWVPWA